MTSLAPLQRRPLPLGLLYYPGARCPSCGGGKFHVGRITAECVWCDAVLVLPETHSHPLLKEV